MKVCATLSLFADPDLDNDMARVLDWVSVYWFSRSGPTASLRIYYEIMDAGNITLSGISLSETPKIPLGYSVFPKDIVCLPRRLASYLLHVRVRCFHLSSKGGFGLLVRWCSSLNTIVEATSRLTRNPKSSLVMCARCLGREDLHSVLYQEKLDMLRVS